MRNHQQLLAAYSKEEDLYNHAFPPGAASEKRTAVAFKSPSTTRFLYNRDLLQTCVRNRPALRNLIERDNGSELRRLVKTRHQPSRDAQAAFLLVAESAAEARDWATACRVLDPVCTNVRLFDEQTSRLPMVLPATMQLQTEMEAMEAKLRGAGMAGTAPPSVFSQLREAVQEARLGPHGSRRARATAVRYPLPGGRAGPEAV